MTGGGAFVAWLNAGECAPIITAAASTAAFANARIMPLSLPNIRAQLFMAISRAPCPPGSLEKLGEACEISLMWPRNHCIDQFAALDEVVQGGVQLVQILTRKANAANSGRCLRRLCHRRFG